jgi:hydrogenase expression/formation protein HypD
VKYIDEFRDGHLAKNLALSIAAEVRAGRSYQLHGVLRRSHPRHFALWRDDLLPANVRMMHGPGCPVCVLPIGRVDMAIDLALEAGSCCAPTATACACPPPTASRC